MESNERQRLLYLAKITQEAEMYSEMLKAVNERMKLPGELTDEERNLLSVAYKNKVSSLRTAYRVISGVSQKHSGDEMKAAINNMLKDKVAAKLEKICNEVEELADYYMGHNETSLESQVFLHKMKADYWRYICETLSGEKRKAYEKASELAKPLSAANPIKLGLHLNLSVFYYEIEENPNKACELAKKAFDDAISELDHHDEDSPSNTFKDSTLIMQLLRDNLSSWTAETAEEESRQ